MEDKILFESEARMRAARAARSETVPLSLAGVGARLFVRALLISDAGVRRFLSGGSYREETRGATESGEELNALWERALETWRYHARLDVVGDWVRDELFHVAWTPHMAAEFLLRRDATLSGPLRDEAEVVHRDALAELVNSRVRALTALGFVPGAKPWDDADACRRIAELVGRWGVSVVVAKSGAVRVSGGVFGDGWTEVAAFPSAPASSSDEPDPLDSIEYQESDREPAQPAREESEVERFASRARSLSSHGAQLEALLDCVGASLRRGPRSAGVVRREAKRAETVVEEAARLSGRILDAETELRPGSVLLRVYGAEDCERPGVFRWSAERTFEVTPREMESRYLDALGSALLLAQEEDLESSVPSQHVVSLHAVYSSERARLGLDPMEHLSALRSAPPLLGAIPILPRYAAILGALLLEHRAAWLHKNCSPWRDWDGSLEGWIGSLVLSVLDGLSLDLAGAVRDGGEDMLETISEPVGRALFAAAYRDGCGADDVNEEALGHVALSALRVLGEPPLDPE